MLTVGGAAIEAQRRSPDTRKKQHRSRMDNIQEPERVLYLGGHACSKTVGIIQLCGQYAHEVRPEQDVPDSLNPESAPRWGAVKKTNHLPAAPRNSGQQGSQKQSKWHRDPRIKETHKMSCMAVPLLFGRTPTPSKDPHLALASLVGLALPLRARPHCRPPYAWTSTSKHVLHWGALS